MRTRAKISTREQRTAYQRGYRERLSYRIDSLIGSARENADPVVVERAADWCMVGADIGIMPDGDRLCAAELVLERGGRSTALRHLGYNAHWIVALLAWWDRNHDTDATVEITADTTLPGDRIRLDACWWEIVGWGTALYTDQPKVRLELVAVCEPNQVPHSRLLPLSMPVVVAADQHDRLMREDEANTIEAF